MNNVYLNGEFLPLEKATISVMDRGFLFGDGVYEVIPVYHGKTFRLQQHLSRLEKSLNAIRIKMPLTFSEWEHILEELLLKNNAQQSDQFIYLQVTRGAANERKHIFPDKIKPTIFIQTSPLNQLSYEELSKGKTAITLNDIRWDYGYIKATSLLPNVLLYLQANDANACEAILIRSGEVTEGATSNVFIVKNNVILTPPLSQYILGGITRDLVIELARMHKIECHEKHFTLPDLMDADEVWITSSTREIYPIVVVNNENIGDGKPGQIWEKMINYYYEFKRDYN